MTTLPHKTLDLPLVETVTDLEHREFDGETGVVLDKDGITGCCDSHAKCTDLNVHFNENDTASRSLGVRDDDVAADFSGRRKSRACQFLPLLRTMKATEIAN